jgi:glycosyltransferase involved in cell wall biosynthesis
MHTVPALFAQLEEIGTGWLPRLYRRRHRDIALFFTGASRTELQSVGVPAEKVRWIDGVVDVAAIEEVMAQREKHRTDVRREISAEPNVPIALSVGRLHPSKGHRHALRAMPKLLERHPDLHWIVLGAGVEMASLRDEARALGLADRAHFLGFREDPIPYYGAADIYLRTPVYEAENLCSYQAMAAAIPVVGFDTGVDTEQLSNVGHGALVVNQNSEALARAGAEILSMPDRGRSLGARGLEYARRHLDIRRTIADYSAAYVSLASRREAAALAPRDVT